MYGVYRFYMSGAVHLPTPSATAVRATSRRYLQWSVSQPD